MTQHICDAVDEEVVERQFDRDSFTRGVAYARRGAVLRLIVDDDGHAITALVVGNRRLPYNVAVTIAHFDDRDDVDIGGHCSCPIGFDCKHIVAVTLEAIRRRDAEFGSAQTERPQRAPQLDPRIALWLTYVDASLEPPAPTAEAVVYLLHCRPYSRRLEIDIAAARRKADGTWSKPRTYGSETARNGQARMLTEDDVHVARLLHATSVLGRRFDGSVSDAALRIALRTERAFWIDVATPLRLGAARDAQLMWLPRPDGAQRLEATIDGVALEIVCTDRVWAIDAKRGEIAELRFAQDDRIASALLDGPAVRGVEVPSVIARFSPLALPLPAIDVAVDVITDPPVPRLHIEIGAVPMYAWGGPPVTTAIATLTFAYGDTRVSPGIQETEWRTTSASGIVVRRRDTAFELSAVATLAERGIRAPVVSYGPPRPMQAATPSPQFWARFLAVDVPALAAAGWVITVADDFPHRVVVHDEPWQIDADGVDDVTLDVYLLVDGRRVPLVPLLADAIAKGGVNAIGDRALVGPLADGAMLSVPAERLRRLVDVLVDVFDRPELLRGNVTIPFARALALEGGDGLQLDGGAAARVTAAAKQLRLAGQRAVAVPQTLRATLRPYQREGLTWLQRLRELSFGGILADSMGLGKTVQTLAHLLAERKRGRLTAPALVIAPTSLLPNWEAEARRFAPSLRTLVLHGARRSERFPDIEKAQLVVTSYALLVRDAEVLTARDWSVAILDEAQNIKNANAKTAKAARMLRASQRLCLTGTPVENHLEELWSLFAFVEPGVLGERERFRRVFRTPIEKRDDTARRAALASRIGPFVLRRTKEAVAADLPPKSEIVTRVELGEAQRDLYETIRAAMHERVHDAIATRGLARSQIIVLDALLKLRQVCCHPKLLPSDRARGVQESAKLDALREMVEEMVDDGRRILLFSQFTSMLRLIEDQLHELGIAYVQLTGETKDRATPVRRFQAGEVPVFLISLKAGGTGLNLTAADTVIHYDPWWNPAVERQATDRAHRIGQTKPLFIYKLVCEQTIEERIIELQARKGAIADALLDEASTSVPLDAAEIARLFE